MRSMLLLGVCLSVCPVCAVCSNVRR